MNKSLLSLLHVRSLAAGLEVSDEMLRLAIFDGNGWNMYAVRLSPGIVEKGRIKDRAAFAAAAAALKKEMGPKHERRRMNVVICLGSVDVYTQVFQLPIVSDKNLDEAVALNLRMASPIEIDEAYYSWEVVGRNEATVQLEILAAFIDRKTVDEVADALMGSGFIAMAVESRGIALTRLIREKAAGVDVPKSYLFVNIDDFGLDFLVIRNGELYFEYQNPWRDMMGEKGEITVEKFKETLAASFRQVLNFYGQHWPEPLGAVILSATAFNAEAEKVITENAQFPAIRLTLVMGQPVSSEWLVVVGSGLRGAEWARKDHEINLLGDESRDRFNEERILHFLGFWSAVVPVTVGLLLLVFIVADVFFANMIVIQSPASGSTVNPQQLSEIGSLDAAAQSFNASVAMLGSVEKEITPKNVVLEKISAVAQAAGITITSVSFQSFSDPISLTGYASTQDGIVHFQTDLDNDPEFTDVALPLTGIQEQANEVAFTMSFIFTPPQPLQ